MTIDILTRWRYFNHSMMLPVIPVVSHQSCRTKSLHVWCFSSLRFLSVEGFFPRRSFIKSIPMKGNIAPERLWLEVGRLRSFRDGNSSGGYVKLRGLYEWGFFHNGFTSVLVHQDIYGIIKQRKTNTAPENTPGCKRKRVFATIMFHGRFAVSFGWILGGIDRFLDYFCFTLRSNVKPPLTIRCRWCWSAEKVEPERCWAQQQKRSVGKFLCHSPPRYCHSSPQKKTLGRYEYKGDLFFLPPMKDPSFFKPAGFWSRKPAGFLANGHGYWQPGGNLTLVSWPKPSKA